MNSTISKFDIEVPSNTACLVFNSTGYCPRESFCKSDHTSVQNPNVLSIMNAYTFDKTQKHGNYKKSVNSVHFNEFFTDFLQELQKVDVVQVIKVLKNDAPHLEGNVLVEFSKAESAKQGFEKFNNRLYNGARLKCKLINIKDWKLASCGKFSRQNCINKTCPFFHYLRNPDGLFKFDYEAREEPKAKSSSRVNSSNDYIPGMYRRSAQINREQNNKFTSEPSTNRFKTELEEKHPPYESGYKSRYEDVSNSREYGQPQYAKKVKPTYSPRPNYSNPRYGDSAYKPTATGYSTTNRSSFEEYNRAPNTTYKNYTDSYSRPTYNKDTYISRYPSNTYSSDTYANRYPSSPYRKEAYGINDSYPSNSYVKAPYNAMNSYPSSSYNKDSYIRNNAYSSRYENYGTYEANLDRRQSENNYDSRDSYQDESSNYQNIRNERDHSANSEPSYVRGNRGGYYPRR